MKVMRLFRDAYKVDGGDNVDVGFFWEVPEGVDQVPVADQDATPTGKGTSSSSAVNKDGEDPLSLDNFKSMYRNLPSTLKSCLHYFAGLGHIARETFVPVILAEGLIPERDGEIIEDTAANVLSELLSLGILQGDENFIQLPFCYRELLVHEAGKEDFVAEAASAKSAVRASVSTFNLSRADERNQYSPLSLEGLLIHSLFYCQFPFGSFDFLQYVWRMEFLVVLHLCWWDEKSFLPEEVGSLVHLRYFGLITATKMKELPRTLGNLQKLQTLQINGYDCKIQLPIEFLKIQNLRHLIISHWFGGVSFVRLPKGIGRLVNLHTCTDVKVGAGIAVELSALTSLRKLGVVDVSDDNVTELLESIMKMENLVSLSLRAQVITYKEDTKLMFFPPLEPFLPPPFLQELHVDGGLFEMPNWLASMENLTRLSLFNSNLSECPTLVLQFLPRLKFLHLLEADIAKLIGKEFCAAGGFPMLETLSIQSEYLVEWTEIVHGAFSHLKCLQFHSCENLRSLPEDLQNISTLKTLFFSGQVNQDHIRRLKGEENYKVKHISEFLLDEHRVIFP